MLEVTGEDITRLDDSDLRDLVARLALSELRMQGHPLSSLTAGGNQDAGDGGIDVRVECSSNITSPDFIPKRLTGFQVKKPDMPPSAIRNEMAPEGILRDAIRMLADASGAYVIVSAQGSVTDKALSDRREAMRDAVKALPNASDLCTDFYDRNRLANWVNSYPGCAAWLLRQVGRPLSGWSGIRNWEGDRTVTPKPYLFDDNACLIDENSKESRQLTVSEGIACLRARLLIPKQCIRLIGLSGVGKTRLVQALFEEEFGESPLDPNLAIYTDYSEQTDPTARDMARRLIQDQQRAILVVDNCNPTTHSQLAQLCISDGSLISLLTVEYDVQLDEPEHTDVFRLQPASPELVSEYIKLHFPEISDGDRRQISENSDGNLRIARAIAETLGRGETLGRLNSRELFERIFQQRNDPDPQLLKFAEDLSLLYSIDGVDVTDGSELSLLGSIRGFGAQPLYETLVELGRRNVVQSRGRFRAILPQAIANRLAASTLDRIPEVVFDRFCGNLTPRMIKSLSRRLGFLHDSDTAKAIVKRWLKSDGPLGDIMSMEDAGISIISNIAPVDPAAVLTKLEQEINSPQGESIVRSSEPQRTRWIELIKAIGYDPSLFDRVITLLTQFLRRETIATDNDIAVTAFRQFFYVWQSGTQASPQQRRSAVRRLATAENADLQNFAVIAMRGLLKSNDFMSLSHRDFGARSRNSGWQPRITQEASEWYEEAIDLVGELAPESTARVLLAESLRGLWHYPGCREALERAADSFTKSRPWIEGWLACRRTLRLDVTDMSLDTRKQLECLVNRLKPTDLLNRARVLAIHGVRGSSILDLADKSDEIGDIRQPWEQVEDMARQVGRELAHAAEDRAVFIPELVAGPHSNCSFSIGRGLAEETEDLSAIWNELVVTFGATQSLQRNESVLRGFISEAHKINEDFASQALENAITTADLLLFLPSLQASCGLDAQGVSRLRRAITSGGLGALSFRSISNGTVSNSPEEPLAQLLNDIANLPSGVEVSLDILHIRLFSNKRETKAEKGDPLLSVGRDLLSRYDFVTDVHNLDYPLGQVISTCLAGTDGRECAQAISRTIRSVLSSHRISAYNLIHAMEALFKTQPLIALDSFLLPSPDDCDESLPDIYFFGRHSPIESLDFMTLLSWANVNPEIRFRILGSHVRMFVENGEDKDISPLFLSLLEQAPDKRLFIGNVLARIQPVSWNGSLADSLARRRELIAKLATHPDEQVRALINCALPVLESRIEQERERDQATEQSFE